MTPRNPPCRSGVRGLAARVRYWFAEGWGEPDPATASTRLFDRGLRAHRRERRARRQGLRLTTFAEVADIAIPLGGPPEVVDVRVEDLTAVVTRAADFDGRWRPTGEHLRWQWCRVSHDHISGRFPDLPSLWDVDGRYYVLDGHLRVSAAAASGADVTAVVTARFTLVPAFRDLAAVA